MSFIRYKKFGKQEYAYEITTIWDSKNKRPRQKTKYMGVVINKEKGIFKKKRETRQRKEKLILDFGDTYLIYQFLKDKNFVKIIEKVFGKKSYYLLTLICYRLCYASAMKYADIWYEGNIARILFKDYNISSQRISDFLKVIGEESLQRKFFKNYISIFNKAKTGIIIDTTALPNQIHCPLSVWGYHDENIDKQIKFLFVIDKNSRLPLFFRYLPGNIVDVSSLKVTMEELKKYGVKGGFLLLDAGFFSEENIKKLYEEKMAFITRLPSSRRLYKEIIKKEVADLERLKNGVRYGKRALFVKQKEVKLFGREIYAYIILDPERKGREVKKELLKVMEEEAFEKKAKKIEYELKTKGIKIQLRNYLNFPKMI